MTDLGDRAQWSLDWTHLPPKGTAVKTCQHCRERIDGGWLRLEQGMVLGATTPHPERVFGDIDLHRACYVPWMEANHPRFVDTRVA